jgi:hypothetical protein
MDASKTLIVICTSLLAIIGIVASIVASNGTSYTY